MKQSELKLILEILEQYVLLLLLLLLLLLSYYDYQVTSVKRYTSYN